MIEAYVQGNMTGKSFGQHLHSAPVSSASKPKKAPRCKDTKWEKKKTKSCVGKCCFKCGKEGHFIAECRGVSNKCLFLAFDGDLRWMIRRILGNVSARVGSIFNS